MDKIRRRFLSSGPYMYRKAYHLLAWNQVCASKEGGLRVIQLD